MDEASSTAVDDVAHRSWPVRHATRLSLLVLDVTAWCVGLLAAAWTRFEFALAPRQLGIVLLGALLCAALHLGLAETRRILRGWYPIGSAGEARILASNAVLVASMVLAVLLTLENRPIAATTPALGSAVALLLMLAGRALHRYRLDRRNRRNRPLHSATPALIYGVDAASERLIRALLSDPNSQYLPVGLLDDAPDKRRLCLDGVQVHGGKEQISEAIRRTGARTVIFSMGHTDAALMREVRTRTLAAGAAFKVLPPIRELLDRSVRVSDVRNMQITDLLGRAHRLAELTVDDNGLAGRRVLVTGAGGSIGSELCRQIARCEPAELMMLDRDESALHALQMSLHGRALLDAPELILADIRDAECLSQIIRDRQPEIVFHAAALKHLTLLQRHPGEAIKTNVWGTLAMLEACRDVPRFVNISTDKAANPISVLGYSKRITERLTAHQAEQFGGAHLSVRFGNVLSSRGSVINAFRAQIEAGLPITVTHPDVTRYFMTVQEAAHLVLQAAIIGTAGEALVLDMGQPVRIADLARRLAAEATNQPEIVFTGLRPGEKLHEDLFGDGEIDTRPLHPLISHVRVPSLDPNEVRILDAYADPVELVKRLGVLCEVPLTPRAAVPLPR